MGAPLGMDGWMNMAHHWGREWLKLDGWDLSIFCICGGVHFISDQHCIIKAGPSFEEQSLAVQFDDMQRDDG